MLDRYILGAVDRVSPEAPVPVVLAQALDLRPGGAANVAASIAAFETATTLLSVAGQDNAADELAAILDKYGVDFQPLRVVSIQTTEKTRVISGTQQIVRVDYESPMPDDVARQVVHVFSDIVHRFSAVVFSDYNKGVLRFLPEMLAIAHEHKIPTYVDPKVSDPTHYRGAFLVKPNAKEFRQMMGEGGDWNATARQAMELYDWQHLVVTHGPDGIVHFSRDGGRVHHYATAQEVYDVSGAGDTVLATIVSSQANGASLSEAIKIANAAAGIAVSRPGTHVVTRDELNTHLGLDQQIAEKARSLSDLVDLLALPQYQGKRIVFTNGCFDILHAGHVRYLNQAKLLGDILIVGLNADSSVKRLKGHTRPINEFSDRAEVLYGLACVDFVVGFDSDTPLDLITALSPQVLVKGGDYTPETIVGADFVKEMGGEVVVIPLIEGRSTTNILSRV